MKNYKVFGFIGSFLLLVFLFTPIASINNNVATILPVFDNFEIASGFWSWMDISAFSITLCVVIPLAAYFIQKEKSIGVFITTTVAMISALFILAATWITDLNAMSEKSLHFHFSYGWILAILALAALYYSGSAIRKEQQN